MATLNQAMYNRAPFNIGNTNTVLWVAADATEFVDRMIGFSKEIYAYPVMNERVTAEVAATNTAMSYTAEGHELIGYQTDMIGQFWLDLQADERMTVETDYSAAAYLELEVTEEWEPELTVSRSYHFTYEMDSVEEISLEHIPYYEAWYDLDAYELVSKALSAESIQETVCFVDITLHPGQHLVIDANNYNVLLDGENVIECQRGEWLDSMNRSTTMLSIQAAVGVANLSASVLYTERYL